MSSHRSGPWLAGGGERAVPRRGEKVDSTQKTVAGNKESSENPLIRWGRRP